MTEKAVCFSGHRPEKLPGRGIADRSETLFIKELLRTKIEQSIREGYTRFYSGVARGIDLWAALAVLDLRKVYPDIKLICVKPVENQGCNFPENDRLLYESVIERADSVVCTSAGYSKNCYAVRNRYMVENSDKLIAFVSNYRSGTGQTIGYARKTGIITDITDLSDITFSMKYEQLEF
ncbi:SLOG family protein [Ruminococcus sp. HUN007]|uniref:SLOG family protein n=1 Tax=Ruminococcus sp. HUN007 TaxID=1514668 RepID=UPI0006791F43|nr:SLOG family protein [Ruminococcus sp. HUN007]